MSQSTAKKPKVGNYTLQRGQKEDDCKQIRDKFTEMGWIRIKFIPNSEREKQCAEIFLDLTCWPGISNIEKLPENERENAKKIGIIGFRLIAT